MVKRTNQINSNPHWRTVSHSKQTIIWSNHLEIVATRAQYFVKEENKKWREKIFAERWIRLKLRQITHTSLTSRATSYIKRPENGWCEIGHMFSTIVAFICSWFSVDRISCKTDRGKCFLAAPIRLSGRTLIFSGDPKNYRSPKCYQWKTCRKIFHS